MTTRHWLVTDRDETRCGVYDAASPIGALVAMAAEDGADVQEYMETFDAEEVEFFDSGAGPELFVLGDAKTLVDRSGMIVDCLDWHE